MKKLFERLLEKIAQTLLRTVSIGDVRCVTYAVPVEEGWGGEKIENFPPYKFFEMFDQGEEGNAISAMEEWYFDRIFVKKLIDRPKTEGGMGGGSLYKDIENLHTEQGVSLEVNLSNVDRDLVKRVIKTKVEYRFNTFKSVKKHGQKFSWDFVRLVSKDGVYLCFGGHHRVSALAVCGHKHVIATVNEPLPLKIVRKMASKLAND
jgi:uncharacterized ParB-like nuclease family protein